MELLHQQQIKELAEKLDIGRASIYDCTMTQTLEIKNHARELKQGAILSANDLVIANPKFDFEQLVLNDPDYIRAMRLFDLVALRMKKDKDTTSDLQAKTASGNEIDSTIRGLVEDKFKFMLFTDPRKHGQIITEEDYYKLVNWVAYYFENNETIPEIKNPIKKVNTDKGNVFYTFKLFYKEIKPNSTYPDNLFKLIQRCFYEYRNDNIDNMKKVKKPQYYNFLLNN